MKRIFIIMSHTLTKEQLEDLKTNFHITDIVYMPNELKNLWSNIPPDINNIQEYINPVLKWIESNATHNDIILIQGDMGATYLTITFANKLNITPYYTTTKRVVTKEVHSDNGEVELIKQFKHVTFRKYIEYMEG